MHKTNIFEKVDNPPKIYFTDLPTYRKLFFSRLINAPKCISEHIFFQYALRPLLPVQCWIYLLLNFETLGAITP